VRSEEQEQLEEDEEELQTIENEIFEYQEIILPYAKKDYTEKKKGRRKRQQRCGKSLA
jgi:hypothetical protein